ncbi:MAG: hypothetical protein ACRC4N_14820, partial [Gammaproteobacteria bacterium]
LRDVFSLVLVVCDISDTGTLTDALSKALCEQAGLLALQLIEPRQSCTANSHRLFLLFFSFLFFSFLFFSSGKQKTEQNRTEQTVREKKHTAEVHSVLAPGHIWNENTSALRPVTQSGLSISPDGVASDEALNRKRPHA